MRIGEKKYSATRDLFLRHFMLVCKKRGGSEKLCRNLRWMFYKCMYSLLKWWFLQKIFLFLFLSILLYMFMHRYMQRIVFSFPFIHDSLFICCNAFCYAMVFCCYCCCKVDTSYTSSKRIQPTCKVRAIWGYWNLSGWNELILIIMSTFTAQKPHNAVQWM